MTHFYIVKLEFTGVYITFLISAQKHTLWLLVTHNVFLLKNIRCVYSLEPPRRGGSKSTPNLCFEQKYEKYQSFLSENFQFLELKFSIYLNRRVFVMKQTFGVLGILCFMIVTFPYTVEPQWHLWDHGNSFETWVVQATEG